MDSSFANDLGAAVVAVDYCRQSSVHWDAGWEFGFAQIAVDIAGHTRTSLSDKTYHHYCVTIAVDLEEVVVAHCHLSYWALGVGSVSACGHCLQHCLVVEALVAWAKRSKDSTEAEVPTNWRSDSEIVQCLAAVAADHVESQSC